MFVPSDFVFLGGERLPLRLPATRSEVRLLGPACLLFCLLALLYTRDVIASSKATPRPGVTLPRVNGLATAPLTRHVCETANAQ